MVGGLGAGDRFVEVALVGLCEQPNDVGGVGGVGVLERFAATSFHPLAVDEIPVELGRGHPETSRRLGAWMLRSAAPKEDFSRAMRKGQSSRS
jgi:hypothetical protein